MYLFPLLSKQPIVALVRIVPVLSTLLDTDYCGTVNSTEPNRLAEPSDAEV